ncbi:MAG: hypothetical protein EXR70_10715 [Deltaproteobacteria bacterium]|nr:hypothetical protein [Deltaproteobacteria bacterium]
MNRYRSINADLVCGVIALLGMVAGIVPPSIQAGPAVIGVLTPGGSYDPVLEGLREGMAKLGFKEGREISYVVEDSKGDVKSFEARAMKLIESKPDGIFTVTTMPTLAVKKATQTIPIVFSVIGDPIQVGVVASFASSQNNLTGVASLKEPLNNCPGSRAAEDRSFFS